ncbi:MAG: hypothetical protein RQ731_10125 [Anaerosomatales bacterium]|nr:hypothetical protein [Anaerosomatales bacterium]MDT8435094.1 hypothetical protein [Anaerosomatales bacterium]
MKRTTIVISVGLAAGVVDLIPLFMVDAPLFNMLSIVAFWLCASFFIYKTYLFRSGLLNGLAVALLLMLPMALAVSATNPKDFVPMISMALVLGPTVGWILRKTIPTSGTVAPGSGAASAPGNAAS